MEPMCNAYCSKYPSELYTNIFPKKAIAAMLNNDVILTLKVHCDFNAISSNIEPPKAACAVTIE